MNNRLLAVIAPFLISFSACAMEQPKLFEKNNVFSIILPGQNGCGGEDYERNLVVNVAAANVHRIDELRLRGKIDLGQGNCIQDFKRQLNALNVQSFKSKNILLHGISQGTATLINGFNELPEHIRSNVKMLTLEAVLGTGNSAIVYHTKKQEAPEATYIPFSRYWLPFVGKIVFPAYNPFGKQALSSAKKLPKDVPVIIMHDQKDPELSINDARQLYNNLKQQGNDVYLLETNKGSHFSVLYKEKNHQKGIQAIYKKHGLPYQEDLLKEDEVIDLTEYQPAVKAVEARIKATDKDEWFWHNIIDRVSFVGLATYALYKKGYLSYFTSWWKKQ